MWFQQGSGSSLSPAASTGWASGRARSSAEPAGEEGWEAERAAEDPAAAPPAGAGPGQPPRGEGRRWAMLRARLSPAQKRAETLSSQYGLHLFLVGLLLMFAWAVHAVGLAKSAVLAYLSALMGLQLLWMAWYLARRRARWRRRQEKDAQAGARWLKCGITLFAVIALIMDVFKIGYFAGLSSCLSITEGIFPVTHAIHTLSQVYFLWCHAKDIIHSFKTLERFGVIHSVFINLLLWTNGVLAESKHHLNEHKERLITLGFGNISIELDDHTPICNCSTAALCSIFSQGIYYLYPFNIEYHILASMMLYVLWKNIGRQVVDLHPPKMLLRFQGSAAGAALGLLVFVATIAVVVVYLIQIGRSRVKSELALRMFYLYAVTVLALMCAAALAALLIYRLEDKSMEVSKNPARKLDADLLVATASGSWLLSWGSILAIILAESHPAYTWYNLCYSILVLLEKYIQNLFIIGSLHHQHEEAETLQVSTVSSGNGLFQAPSGKEVYNGELPCLRFNGNVRPPENSSGCAKDENQPNCPASLPAPNFLLTRRKWATCNKRRILINTSVFLFLCNLSLWIPQAFGCRPEYDNGLEEMVFGFEPWIIVVNLAMPFSIFYRMHSAASLFEISVSCRS